MRQTGYLIPGMAIGLVLLSLACAALWKVAGSEREARAVAEAKTAQWMATAEACSAATEKLAKEGKNRARAAQDALRRAQAASAGSAAEIARLRASKAGTCEAAVKAVREGLKP